MSELKKCPFCGGEFYIDVGGMIYIPRCKKCGCSLAGCRTREKAVEIANRRIPMDNIVEKLEEEKSDCGERTGYFKGIEKAINIVKQEEW